MNIKDVNITQADLEALIARYFDADTSHDEERLLRKILLSGQCQETPPVREALAMLSLGEMQRRRKSQLSRRLVKRIAAGAAAIAASVALVLGSYTMISASSDVCECYIAGVRVTDHTAVLRIMENDFADINSVSDANVVMGQLSDCMNMVSQDI